MTEQSAGANCVVIEDNDLNDDQPGPVRLIYRPSACDYEAKWFERPFHRPTEQVVSSDIPEKCINAFKDLIWNQPHDRMVPGYGMTPKELASVSSEGRKGWLVTSHFYWLSRCINQQQDHTCFFVLDPAIRKASLQKLLSSKSAQDIKQLVFVMSVGRQDDGDVYLGTDKTPGDHWSIAIVNITTSTLSYCDTLGWPVPDKLYTCIIKYTNFLGLSQSSQLTVRMAHKPNCEQHECTEECTNYPLQTCSDVCGVIAMICIAIAALDQDLFELLMKPINKDLNLYLTDPTEYSFYLRHVLIYWLSTNHIDMSKIKLRPDFDPHVCSSHPRPALKRKLDTVTNGGGDATPKRLAKNKYSSQNKLNINEYILECIAAKVRPDDLVSEVFKEYGQNLDNPEALANTIRSQYSDLTFNDAIERDKEPELSIKSYVKDLVKNPGDNPVIFYKNKGKAIDNFSEDDFCVAIQTKFQKQMMVDYGKKCLCVDLPKKQTAGGLYIMTILVFVEGTDELPVAWLISNKNDNITVGKFFKMLKSNVGPLQTEIFLGDISWTLFKLWSQHFPKPLKKMFCTWEVQNVLKHRLKSQIVDMRLQKEIANYLSVSSLITSVEAFKGYMNSIFAVLKPHQEFLDYLKTTYFESCKDEFWASCYRHIPASKYVPFLEPFTQTMKALGFFMRSDLRVDVLFHRLLQLNTFLEIRVHILPSHVRHQTVVKNITMKHNLPSSGLDFYQSPTGDEWYFRSSAETNAFSVLDSGLTTCECGLKCPVCKFCVHRYICTCPDYLLRVGVCKHPHLIHSFRQMTAALEGESTAAKPEAETNLSIDQLRSSVQKDLVSLSKKIHQIHDVKKLQNIFLSLQSSQDS